MVVGVYRDTKRGIHYTIRSSAQGQGFGPRKWGDGRVERRWLRSGGFEADGQQWAMRRAAAESQSVSRREDAIVGGIPLKPFDHEQSNTTHMSSTDYSYETNRGGFFWQFIKIEDV
jgi:hypothetical protein